ncbi:adenosylcobinamide-GDP ribazoletransferase [Staphylococcus chromogenes]|nr:adenosylcobinamide-GDP ribazoletransferase [Staphylococcus chromogenes]
MSGKAGTSGEGEHQHPLVEGPATIISWLTIFPAKGANVFDRTTGARAMAALPVTGFVVGAVAALAAYLLDSVATPLLTGAITVFAFEMLTRMMHIDGLADVGDALGSYATPARAQEILADATTGAMGLGTVVLVLLLQVAAVAEIATQASPVSTGFAVLLVATIARLSGMVGCLSGFRPFSANGFGSLIIGTVRWWWILAWALVLAAGLAAYGVGVDKQCALGGALALGLAPALAWFFVRHCHRRFAGLNGDCIGASIELAAAVAATAIGLVLSL